jgi:hypothetical protein
MVSSQTSAIEVTADADRDFEGSTRSCALVDVFLVRFPPVPFHAFELAMFQLFGEIAPQEHLLPLLVRRLE